MDFCAQAPRLCTIYKQQQAAKIYKNSDSLLYSNVPLRPPSSSSTFSTQHPAWSPSHVQFLCQSLHWLWSTRVRIRWLKRTIFSTSVEKLPCREVWLVRSAFDWLPHYSGMRRHANSGCHSSCLIILPLHLPLFASRKGAKTFAFSCIWIGMIV